MSKAQENLLQCYNRGCGQQFDPNNNNEGSCTFHPGVPVFHDAYKGWSCCNKKTTDFTEFLNIKGCTTSFHNNVKPVEPEKPKIEQTNVEEIVKSEISNPKPPKPLERPSEDLPMIKLNATTGASLKPLLEKIKKLSTDNTHRSVPENTVIEIGTSCKNGGCKKSYEGEHSNSTTCVYHPGIPVFHEGLKYWSCCLRKTTDFETFLEQEGCTTGNHIWHKKQEAQINCRHDWHQTGSQVVVSVYSKIPIPEISCIEANPVKLSIHIVFGEEKNIYDMEFLLFGIIDVEKSNVVYLGSKVEINLKKAEIMSWRKLSLPTKLVESKNLDNKKQKVTNEDNSDDNLDDIS